MRTITVAEVTSRFSEVLDLVQKGEEIGAKLLCG